MRQRVFVMEIKNRLLLPFLKPPITGHFPVVQVDFSVAFEPLVVLAGGQIGPLEQGLTREFRTLGPILHVVDNLVASVVGR